MVGVRIGARFPNGCRSSPRSPCAVLCRAWRRAGVGALARGALHHQGDLLSQAPAARFSRKSPAQEVILLSGSDGTRLPDRWIRVEAFVTLRPKSHHFYTPKGHAAAPAGTVRQPSTSELTSSPRWPFPVTWFLRLFAPPARSRPVAAVDPSAGPVNASPERDTSWEAIVEQLRATPSDDEPDQPPEFDYAWAGRLGMHINRRPKRR